MITHILLIGAISTYLLFAASSSPTVVEWLGGIHFVPPPFTPIVVVNPFMCRDCSRSTNERLWLQPCCPGTDVKCRCGVEGNTRIVAGSYVPRGKYPWIASVTFNNDAQAGGPITSIVLGEHDISSIDALDIKRKDVRIEKIITHPGYVIPINNDIALLKLAEEVDLSVHTPACLPASGRDFTGSIGTVYGWGTINHCLSFTSPLLQEVSQQILSDSTCAAASGNYFGLNSTTGRCELETGSYAGFISEDMVC